MRKAGLLGLIMLSGCGWDLMMPTPEYVAGLVFMGPGDHSLSLEVDGLEREYIVHVPAGTDFRDPVPVVIMFHGAGSSAVEEMWKTGWPQKADQEGFLAVFPEATRPFLKQRTQARTNPQIWNDGSGMGVAGIFDVDDVAFVDALLDDAAARFLIDQSRIYATGFSNGASFTFRVAAELGDRIAAAAPVCGHLRLDEVGLVAPVPLLFIMGTADPLHPVEGGEVYTMWGTRELMPPLLESPSRWAALLGCDTEPVTVLEADGVTLLEYGACADQDTEVLAYTIAEQGHLWPGGRSLQSATLVGDSTDKLNATDVIWEFFASHANP
ncbi:MAG: dienelactone hydrolase family protein [Planctomycetes bacterium]|nr:dienelactone hydrolase family protein [Planctomycetota bacterium]